MCQVKKNISSLTRIFTWKKTKDLESLLQLGNNLQIMFILVSDGNLLLPDEVMYFS